MTGDPSKNDKKTTRKRFETGGPGGPGRPEGCRNRATVLLDKMASDKAKEILEKVITAAEGGDMRASELLLSRIWPSRKTRAVSIDLPGIKNAADTLTALGAIVTAAASGEIGLEEAQILSGLVDAQRRSIESTDLEARIAKLEAQTAK